MSINWQEILFNFLGGLGLFLYSIKTMGEGLQQAAGDRLRYYIDKYTSNPFLGVLVGIVVTALIQSSTGVTVITVGLVSAGLLTLRQAIGIIMGANIGTTVTSFIIGFKLGTYALPIMFLGTVLLFFTKNRMANNIGRILFGVGGIFYALNLISAGMSPLKELPEFSQYMITLGKNPILGVLAGAIIHRFDSSFVSHHWDSTRFVFRWFSRSSRFFTYSFWGQHRNNPDSYYCSDGGQCFC